MVRLELNINLASIPGSLRPFFSQAFNKESMLILKWELAITKSKKNLLLPRFKKTESMIEIILGF